jgi:AcrR family transcriptional regulator
VGASQRSRLLAAVLTLASVDDPAAITVRGLSGTAGISTRTFYEHFRNVDECTAAALARTTDGALRSSWGRTGTNGDEPGLSARFRDLYAWVENERRQSRFLLIDCYCGGRALGLERGRAERRFESALAESLGLTRRLNSPSLRGTVAGLTHTARSQLTAVNAAATDELASELGRWALSISDDAILTARPRGAGRAPILRASGRTDRWRGATPGDDRERVLDAVIKLAAKHGYRSLTGPRIRAQAGVGRRRFDHLFAGSDQCFLEGVQRLALSLIARVEQASAVAEDWPARVVHGSITVCHELALRPAVARLTLVEILAPGPPGLRWREKLITDLAGCLYSRASSDWRSSPLATTASVAASWRILESEVLAHRERLLPRLAPTIARTLLAPAGAEL